MTQDTNIALNGRNILVVEDEPLISLMLSEHLQDLGFASVEVIESRDAALARIASAAPDMALLDVGLTDGDTSSVAKVLHERGVPFVLMSGDPSSAIRLGFDGVPVLGKPFSPADLQTALLRAAKATAGAAS